MKNAATGTVIRLNVGGETTAGTADGRVEASGRDGITVRAAKSRPNPRDGDAEIVPLTSRLSVPAEELPAPGESPRLAYVRSVKSAIALKSASHRGAALLNIFLPQSIRLKLLLAFGTMTIIIGAMGAWSISQVTELADINKKTYDRTVMAINYARWADTEFERIANTVKSSEKAANADQSTSDIASDLFDNLDVAEKSATSHAAASDVQRLRNLTKEWLGLQEAGRHRSSHLLTLTEQVRHAFEILVEQNSTDGFLQREHASIAEAGALRFSIIMTGSALGLAIFMTLLLSSRVVAPLTAAANVARRIASGELDTLIPSGGRDEAGALLSSMSVMQKRIVEMMEAEAARRRSAQGRLVAALETLTSAMLLLDRDGVILIANSKAEEFLSLVSAKPEIGASFASVFPAHEAGWGPILSSPGEVLMPNNKWVSIERESTEEGGSFLILNDITERKSYEQRLEIAAYQDPITGIHNRAYLIARAKEKDWSHFSKSGLVILNIERFRQINNAHGNQIGDDVLKEIARRLKSIVSEENICSRVGPDEFAIWLPITDLAEITRLLERIQEALSVPIQLDELKLGLKTRIGAAIARPELASIHDLSRNTRAALGEAKRLGGGRSQVFDDRLRQESEYRTRIEEDLPEAIRNGEIYLDYQPLIDTRRKRIGGFEALARWRHKELGQVPPIRFVSIAEECGAIVDLGMHVLNLATTQSGAWAGAGQIDDDFTVAVNMSPRQVTDPRNARQLLDYLDGLNTSARRLKLEITEGVLLEDPTAMLSLLKALKERGCDLSLDDFGTGYSSLSYLHKFPFDVLKIDRSFVMNVDKDNEARRLVRTIIELGQDLGMALVAEGVETASQAAFLSDLGCDYIQGYYYSKPVAVTAATELLGLPKSWV